MIGGTVEGAFSFFSCFTKRCDICSRSDRLENMDAPLCTNYQVVVYFIQLCQDIK